MSILKPSLSHDIVGVGFPLAAQSKVTVWPSITICERGEAIK